MEEINLWRLKSTKIFWIMFDKVMSFEIPHHLVEFPVWDFPVQH
jgi:hypothetical protein